MKKSPLSFLLKLSIILIGIIGLCICIFWYPAALSGELGAERIPILAEKGAEYYIQLIFFLTSALPCFVILIYGWLIANDIKRESVFSKTTVKKFKTVFYILFTDAAIFLFGNFIFMLLAWNPFILLHFALGTVAIIISFFFYIIAHFVDKAEKIKEENDSIL